MASNEIQLKIKQMRKPPFTVSVAANGSINDLRDSIQNSSEVEPNRQRLIYMGRVLKPDQTIAHYKLKNNDTIHLIVRSAPVEAPRNDEPPAPAAQPQQPMQQVGRPVQGMAVVGVSAPQDFSLDQIMSNVLGSFGGSGGNDGGQNIISNIMQRARSASQGSLGLPNMIRIMPTTTEIDQRLEGANAMLRGDNDQAMDVDELEDVAARLDTLVDAALGDSANEVPPADSAVDEKNNNEEEATQDTVEDVIRLMQNVSGSVFNGDCRERLDELTALLANQSSVENRDDAQQRIRKFGEILCEYGTVLTSTGHALRRVTLGNTPEEAKIEPFSPPQQIQVTAYSIQQHQHGNNDGNQPVEAVDIEVDIGDGANAAANAANGVNVQGPNPQANILDNLLSSLHSQPVVVQQNPAEVPATQPATSSAAPANPMANLMQSVAQMIGGSRGQGGGSSNQAPFSMLSNLLQSNQPSQPAAESKMSEAGPSSAHPEQLVSALAREISKYIEISNVAACKTGDWSILRALYAPLRAFVRESGILDVVIASKRSQVSRDLVLGVSRLLVGTFAQDKRDVLRTVTEMHFKYHMRRLVDILIDSPSSEAFEEALIEWGDEALTAWIYKLSVNFSNGISGVKNCLSQIGIQWLGSIGVRRDHLQVLPEFVKHFVDGGYQIHVGRLQRDGRRARLSSQEEWAYSLPPNERQRWQRTVQMDTRRSTSHALPRGYQFSPSYSGNQENPSTEERRSTNVRQQRRSHFSPSAPHAKKRRLNPKEDE